MFGKLFFVLSVSLICTSPLLADRAVQDDWSGGGGFLGPVLFWGNHYYDKDSLETILYPDSLLLEEYLYDYEIDSYLLYACGIEHGDIDSDGDQDLVVCGYGADAVVWWENQDDAMTWEEHTIADSIWGAWRCDIGDIDGDNTLDVAVTAFDMDRILWFSNSGGGSNWTETIIGAGTEPKDVELADVDGDGDLDAFCVINHTTTLIWYENENNGASWTGHTIDDSMLYVLYFAFAQDITGNGYPDVLASDRDSLYYYENGSGGTSWTKHTVGAMDQCECGEFADVDGDMDYDIVCGQLNGDGLVWWENDSFSWTSHVIGTEYWVRWLSCADMDDDGDSDIVAVSDYSKWYENTDGDGSNWTHHYMDSGGMMYGVCTADLSNDGKPDIAATDWNNDNIIWWNINAHYPHGTLTSSILDTEMQADWGQIDWTCSQPSGTQLEFQVRSGDDPDTMTGWSTPIQTPEDLSSYITDGHRYVQYKALFSTDHMDYTPVLEDISVYWSIFVGTAEGERPTPSDFVLLGANPNPSFGSTVIEFQVPVQSNIQFAVYDLAGRSVLVSSQDWEPGTHALMLDKLPSGMYMINMVSKDFSASRKFIVM